MIYCTPSIHWHCHTLYAEVFILHSHGYLLAGEGYECAVTIDDEDSKVIIFDNWKQVSY